MTTCFRQVSQLFSNLSCSISRIKPLNGTYLKNRKLSSTSYSHRLFHFMTTTTSLLSNSCFTLHICLSCVFSPVFHSCWKRLDPLFPFDIKYEEENCFSIRVGTRVKLSCATASLYGPYIFFPSVFTPICS